MRHARWNQSASRWKASSRFTDCRVTPRVPSLSLQIRRWFSPRRCLKARSDTPRVVLAPSNATKSASLTSKTGGWARSKQVRFGSFERMQRDCTGEPETLEADHPMRMATSGYDGPNGFTRRVWDCRAC